MTFSPRHIIFGSRFVTFVTVMSFYPGRALRNAPPGVLSAFPGAPPGTDKSHKGGDTLEFRGAAAATRAVLALVAAAT